ncbi:putative membrane protein (TIGR01666 family) [Luteibacter rhizovicinus]|uniref:Putative membrane protein (TIGR01666 family) n=1 Tax=Luteibacter rhizovicinus TaxID=242606 RepID=A0A4R3YVE1_9GAMM|nr:YccS family putative transporter [Luteibacter rhizovicinus]TCV97075.1 putative membrane protein (TIGR01666 family) [Luteibacter rhizovicinus]
MPFKLRQRISSIAESDRLADVVRVLLALSGVLAWCVLHGPRSAAIPALLGVIACALAETDDAWRGRLRGLVVTLCCFAIAAATVRWLIAWPWLFALALPVGTFALVMLGAASGRYATIVAATLILSVYTMIDADAAGPTGGNWVGTVHILAGAAWYGALSLLWSVFAPQRAVRLALARVFEALAAQMETKAALFEPVHDLDRHALEIELAHRNGRTVDAMNEAHGALLDRMGRRQPRGRTAQRLRLYFTAQDIHERISSTHYPYEALVDALFHSDIMFRFGRLLRLQAQACHTRADEVRRTLPPGSLALPHGALDDVRAALAHGQPREPRIDEALAGLLRNVERLQSSLETESEGLRDTDFGLRNYDPPTWREAVARIRVQTTRRSMRFRHAVRLAAGMLAGYALLLAVHPRHGYWILLTTLFVCQPGYGATRRRLGQRIGGTMLGLIAGWAFLRLLPGGDWRLPVTIVSGAAFFAFRHKRYTVATATITLFVVLCFDQIGAGYDAIGPRLLDTVLGSVIAAAALHFVLPDWRARQLEDLLADVIDADGAYLRHIANQYVGGKVDDLPYRVARRDAHNAHAALAGSVTEMLAEPVHSRERSEVVLRLVTESQTTLAHLSTLGAHREALTPGAEAESTLADAERLAAAFGTLAMSARTRTPPQPLTQSAWMAELELRAERRSGTERLITQQCLLLARDGDRFAALLAEM